VRAGVERATGFFLNVSNFQPTEQLIKYGSWISRCIWYAADPGSTGKDHFEGCGSQYYPADVDDFSTWALTDQWYLDNVESQPSYPGDAGLKHFVIDTSRNGQRRWVPLLICRQATRRMVQSPIAAWATRQRPIPGYRFSMLTCG
jgi:endoglucanase